MIRTTLRLDNDLHHRMAIRAAEEKTTIQRLLTKALKSELDWRKLTPLTVIEAGAEIRGLATLDNPDDSWREQIADWEVKA